MLCGAAPVSRQPQPPARRSLTLPPAFPSLVCSRWCSAASVQSVPPFLTPTPPAGGAARRRSVAHPTFNRPNALTPPSPRLTPHLTLSPAGCAARRRSGAGLYRRHLRHARKRQGGRHP
eukprot:scaffold22497_cov103-Isochrysis_galbana.AAC.4